MSQITDNHAVIEYVQHTTGRHGAWEETADVTCPKCLETDFCYVYVDGRLHFCAICDMEWDIDPDQDIVDDTDEADLEELSAEEFLSGEFAAANHAAAKQIEKGTPPMQGSLELYKHSKMSSGGSYGNAGTSGTDWPTTSTSADKWKNWSRPTCTHMPTHIIAGEGWGVWAGKKYDVELSAKDYDVVLNLTGDTIKEQHYIPIPELKKWEDGNNYGFTEMLMAWQDFGTVELPRAFWEDLVNYCRDNQKKLLVFCQGGHGRTGTAIATLMVVALGWSPRKAIKWVRRNYCASAIETHGQEAYVQSMHRCQQQPEVPDQKPLPQEVLEEVPDPVA